MAFPFLSKVNLPELARQLTISSYVPQIKLEDLRTGVDNVRTDVWLSPRFMETTTSHIAKLLARYGNVEDFLVEDTFAKQYGPALAQPPVPRSAKTTTVPLPAAANAPRPTNPGYVGPAAEKVKTVTMFTGGLMGSPLDNVGASGPMLSKPNTTAVNIPVGGHVPPALKTTTKLRTPPGGWQAAVPGARPPIESGEFKRTLTDMLTASLNKAKAESNIH